MSWGFTPLLPAAAQQLSAVVLTLTAEAASFTATGVDAGIAKTGYALQAETGSFTGTYSDAGLVYTNTPPLIKDIFYISAGSGTSGTGGPSLVASTSFNNALAAGDLVLVFIETNGEVITPPVDWVAVPNTPVNATGTTLFAFYRFAGSWVNSTQVFSATAFNHFTANFAAFRNVSTSDPFANSAVATVNTPSTSVSWPGITTTRDKSWLVHALANGLDSGTANLGAVTLSGVTGITERFDGGTTTGDGGQLALVTSFAATAGTFGSATATLTTASEQALLTLALNPQQYTGLILNANSTDLTPQVSGTTNSFNNVRYLEGAYYALGSTGGNLRSTDGVNWSSSLFTNSGSDIAFGNGVYVATQSNVTGIVQRSTNGTAFSSASHGQGQSMTGVAFGNGVFVIAGNSGALATSPDGSAWTGRVSGVTTNLNSVIWTGSQFVALGNLGVVLTSPDGAVWTRQNNVPNSSDLLNSVAFGDGVYVASAGASNSIWVSHDAVNWRAIGVSLPSSSNQRVNWTGSQFVLTTSNGGLATSPDGYRWTVLSTGTTTNITGSAVNGNQMVLVGSGGAIWTTTPPSGYQFGVQSSVDSGPKINRLYAGRGLRNVRRIFNAGNTSNLGKPATNGAGTWVIPRVATTVGYSLSTDDGLTITGPSSVSAARQAAAFGAGMFVFVGIGGFIESSPTGLGSSWTTRTSGTANNLLDVIYADGRFVAVGVDGSVCTSTDGITWSHNLTGFGVSLASVIWDGAQYTASSATDNTTYVSTDGVTWTAGASIFGNSTFTYRLAYGNGVYLASASNSSTVGWSIDRVNWNLANLPALINAGGFITHTGKKFIAVKNATVLISENGEQWLDAGLSNSSTLGAAASDSNGNILITGNSGVIWSAQDEAFPSRFTLTGYDAFFSSVIAYQFSAEQGAYTAAAQDANLLFSRWLTADVRSYAYAGQSATLSYGRNLLAAQGSYTLNGLSAGTYYSRSLPADAGTYNAAYLAANLLSGLRLVAAPAPLQTVGVAAGTLAGRHVVADQNSATVLPRDAQVLAGRRLVSDAQSLAYTGIAADVLAGRRVLADARSHATAFQSANLLSSRWLLASQAPLSVSLLPANLATGFGLVANPGMFALSASEAQWAWNRVLSGEAVSYNHAVYQASLLAARRFGADAALYSTSFQPSTLAYGRHVTAALGAYNLQTSDLLFGRNYRARVDTGGFNVLGSDSQANKTLFFGVQPGLFQILGYSSQPFFSALVPAKDVAWRTEELRRAQRPQEVKLAVRRPDAAAAVLPAEDTVSFVVPRDPAVRGSEDRITYH